MEELAKEILEEYASAYSQIDLETLAKTLEEIKQTTAKEIIDLANEVLEFFEKEDNLVDEHKVCIRLALKFFKLKIMERYGV